MKKKKQNNEAQESWTTIRVNKADHQKLKVYAVLNQLSMDEAFAELVKGI